MKLDCQHIIHPFQEDSGVSQRERSRRILVKDPPKIDGRTLADLLDYFLQLAPHVNYYDSQLNTSDWQPFFKKSKPFILAGMVRFNTIEKAARMERYNRLFNKKPSKHALQLLINFIFNNNIQSIISWYKELKDDELPVSSTMESLVRRTLGEAFRKFRDIHDDAVKRYCIRRLDLSPVTSIVTSQVNKQDLEYPWNKGRTRRERIMLMRDELLNLNQALVFALQVIAGSAQKSIGRSLIPLQEKLRKEHLPHLGLLFAFLKLFRYLQKDLNSVTRKQLDYFYKDVLSIQPSEAVADQAHIVFEIQKQLKKYMLKKGLLVKDGKDNNKAEIFFSLEDDIVVNKAQVVDQRALHLDNGYAHDYRYLKGLYIANDLTMADGMDKPFPDGQPKNYPTTGAALSKYIIPGTSLFKPYPRARVGFVLASPVLLLNEGSRTVDIHINCFLREQLCDQRNPGTELRDPCCEEHSRGSATSGKPPICGSGIYSSGVFLEKVREMLKQEYYYVSQPLIQEALKNGITKTASAKLMNFLLVPDNKLCYCPAEQHYFDRSVEAGKFESYFSTDEKTSLGPWFRRRSILQVSFSGEKEWIVPARDKLTIDLADTAMGFDLHIGACFDPAVAAITYFDGKALKEKIDTKLPVVKVMLDDSIKMYVEDSKLDDFARHEKIKKQKEQPDCCPDNSVCCVRRDDPSGVHEISLYQFFRSLVVNNSDDTKIDVKVCGVKKLIVQNDDSVQDVNAPIFPFGTRPKIIDFDVIDPPNPPLTSPNLVGPNFYLGSKEIFLKKWTDLCINFTWKDKPSDFNEHYKAYLKRENYHNCNSPLNNKTIYGLNECDFKVMLSLLDDGKWKEEASKRDLFNKGFCNAVCKHDPQTGYYSFHMVPGNFGVTTEFIPLDDELVRYDIKSRYGFVRINLRDQDFLHKDYAFVLARQMMALSMFDGQKTLEGAVYLLSGDTVIVFKNTGQIIIDIQNLIKDVKDKTILADDDVNDIINAMPGILDSTDPAAFISLLEYMTVLLPLINSADATTTEAKDAAALLFGNLNMLKDIISIFEPGTDKFKEDLSVPIPNEPWTPVMENLSVDYTASAAIDDIQLIHLYPFKDTYRKEEIKEQPSLFPLHCDEGSLFIGIKELEPGSNLNILFQLAEATADTEADKAIVQWQYLSNNQWKPLRPGFEVLDDKTAGLTASGIVKFATPEDMTQQDTIMPADREENLFWIKAAIRESSRAVCETIGIHAQAILATFTNDDSNDRLRLSQPLPAGSIAKLQVADANVKKTEQPYDSTGGIAPENSGHYYERVSELLRHKGRAIQKFDYERFILEAFPQVYRVKCISHSFALDAGKYITDFPIAPGYVTVAVIPDLNKVKAGNVFEPGLATTVLEKITASVKIRTSPFVRLRIMNPRYERINICLKVKLVQGKDEKYFKEKMEEDIRTFLAPWAVGEYSKLKFGQCINHSDLVGFLESKDYMDYILDLQWGHESDWHKLLTSEEKQLPDICPKTPRSILIGGRIDICILGKDCEELK